MIPTGVPVKCPRCRGAIEATKDGTRCPACRMRWVAAVQVPTRAHGVRYRHYFARNRSGSALMCGSVSSTNYTTDREAVTCPECISAIKSVVDRDPDMVNVVKLRRVCQACRFWRGSNTLQGYCYEHRRLTARNFACIRHTF